MKSGTESEEGATAMITKPRNRYEQLALAIWALGTVILIAMMVLGVR